MTEEPDASTITVPEVLSKLETEFAAFTKAVENGEFAFWIGSGISRQAPNLGRLLEQGIEFLRKNSDDEGGTGRFYDALREVLEIAGIDSDTLDANLSTPFSNWGARDVIVNALWNSYSQVLDIRIQGEAEDYILWDAIDIRNSFKPPAPPAPEHLCIAALILEGAVSDLVSANWDTFIEQAVDQLSGGAENLLKVVVEPNQLRRAHGRARLLKFHGCIKHADDEPETFRKYLTGSTSQITDWPNNPLFAAVRNEFVSIATTKRALVMGLSLQDQNLHQIISIAKNTHPWPWPCEPEAPGYVFCQDTLPPGQKAALKVAYSGAFEEHGPSIVERSHMRAWPEQVLVALLLKLVFDKLHIILMKWLDDCGKSVFQPDLDQAMKRCQLLIAEAVGADRNLFVENALSIWPRVLSVFKFGALPAADGIYHAISSSSLTQVPADDAPRVAQLGKLALGLAVFQLGHDKSLWCVEKPEMQGIEDGVFAVKGTWDGAQTRPVFLVKSVTEALELEKEGAFEESGAIVVHGDDLWPQLRAAGSSSRSPSSSPGRSGNVRTTHISLTKLLDESDSAQSLHDGFVLEAAI